VTLLLVPTLYTRMQGLLDRRVARKRDFSDAPQPAEA